MKAGDVVTLMAVGDRKIVRRVVAVEHAVVFVCREEEHERALAEGREPVAMGFPLGEVLGVEDGA